MIIDLPEMKAYTRNILLSESGKWPEYPISYTQDIVQSFVKPVVFGSIYGELS